MDRKISNKSEILVEIVKLTSTITQTEGVQHTRVAYMYLTKLKSRLPLLLPLKKIVQKALNLLQFCQFNEKLFNFTNWILIIFIFLPIEFIQSILTGIC